MKVVAIHTLIDKGAFASSSVWRSVREQAHEAVRAAEWPVGSGSFTIYPESGKKRGQGNGVTPIKDLTISRLTAGRGTHGEQTKKGARDFRGYWVAEHPRPVGERIRPGCMDAAFVLEDGFVCLEWETGNISSSHRSINKMCLGLIKGSIKAGMLVVPSRALYPYLTDRIGNVAELEPYFDLWRATACDEGVLEIIVIEHDATSTNIPRIPKGTDGRALA